MSKLNPSSTTHITIRENETGAEMTLTIQQWLLISAIMLKYFNESLGTPTSELSQLALKNFGSLTQMRILAEKMQKFFEDSRQSFDFSDMSH